MQPPPSRSEMEEQWSKKPGTLLNEMAKRRDFSGTYTLAHFQEWWGQSSTRDRWAVKWVKDVILLNLPGCASLFH